MCCLLYFFGLYGSIACLNMLRRGDLAKVWVSVSKLRGYGPRCCDDTISFKIPIVIAKNKLMHMHDTKVDRRKCQDALQLYHCCVSFYPRHIAPMFVFIVLARDDLLMHTYIHTYIHVCMYLVASTFVVVVSAECR